MTITSAPASAAVVAGGPGSQMSSQIVIPTVTPLTSTVAGRGTRLEVALLVEDAVVRQPQLAVDAGDLAVGEHGRGVVDVVGVLGEADDRDDVDRLGGQVGKGSGRLVEEVRLEQQVLGRVAGQRQLGEDDQRRAALARLDGGGGDPVRVAGDVADGRVDLRERAAQRLGARGHAEIMA